MAANKSKRSVFRAQPRQVRAHVLTSTARRSNLPLVKPSKKKKLPVSSDGRRMKFPVIKGKTIEEVDFSTRAEDHSITLVFRDKTALRLGLEPGFTMFANLEDWKRGDVRVIRRWPGVRSWMFRE